MTITENANGNRNSSGYTVGTGNQITTDAAGNALVILAEIMARE
jgi:hypothetical protein